MSANDSITVSFDEIFGATPDDISMEKLNLFLEEVIENMFQQSNRAPYELVRVVERGRIRWITAEDAAAIIGDKEDAENKTLKQSIQNALRGDSVILDREIRVLFLLANGSLKQYREHNLIPLPEIKRTEPQLIRIGRQIHYQLNELRGIEQRILEVRRKNPILDQFEQKMGMLLNLQKEGRMDEATPLAIELASLKKKYILISRVLSTEINQSYRCRMEIQYLKKSVLSWQRYLFAQREGVLQNQLQTLRKSVENIKFLLTKESGSQKEKYQSELNEKEDHVQKNEMELASVQKEQAILEKQEKETDCIINHIRETLEGPEETSAAEKKPEAKADVKEEPAETKESSRPQPRRMITIERQEQRNN
ncbi:MAG: hypothetical protein C4527_29235 [Candidatus Omnitrophota bacterium]|jgi:hypothetical protein|nr:MAG: hypothetical protein C4527_29235 [Candidatus Omnitrophota bacterium]